MAPTIATSIEYKLNPVTPCPPMLVKMKPPTRAPTIPSATFRMQPSPRRFTTRLAMKPEIKPKNIQPRIDMLPPKIQTLPHQRRHASPAGTAPSMLRYHRYGARLQG